MSAQKYASVDDVIGLWMKPLRSEASLNFCLNLLKGEKQTTFIYNKQCCPLLPQFYCFFPPGLPPPPTKPPTVPQFDCFPLRWLLLWFLSTLGNQMKARLEQSSGQVL